MKKTRLILLTLNKMVPVTYFNCGHLSKVKRNYTLWKVWQVTPYLINNIDLLVNCCGTKLSNLLLEKKKNVAPPRHGLFSLNCAPKYVLFLIQTNEVYSNHILGIRSFFTVRCITRYIRTFLYHVIKCNGNNYVRVATYPLPVSCSVAVTYFWMMYSWTLPL